MGRGGEAMTESPRAKAKVTFQDIDVTATKDRLWHVEAAGRSASAEFLDQAIDLVLPRLSLEEQASLVIRLLTAREAEPGSSPASRPSAMWCSTGEVGPSTS
jgi:hypothetical protein